MTSAERTSERDTNTRKKKKKKKSTTKQEIFKNFNEKKIEKKTLNWAKTLRAIIDEKTGNHSNTPPSSLLLSSTLLSSLSLLLKLLPSSLSYTWLSYNDDVVVDMFQYSSWRSSVKGIFTDTRYWSSVTNRTKFQNETKHN